MIVREVESKVERAEAIRCMKELGVYIGARIWTSVSVLVVTGVCLTASGMPMVLVVEDNEIYEYSPNAIRRIMERNPQELG